jgi:hypothetical protein
VDGRMREGTLQEKILLDHGNLSREIEYVIILEDKK